VLWSRESVWVGMRECVEIQWWPSQSRKELIPNFLLIEHAAALFTGETQPRVGTKCEPVSKWVSEESFKYH